MSGMSRVMNSPYMEWAKLRSGSRFNLASSGVANYPLSLLPVRPDDLELNGGGGYGHPPLQQAIAGRFGVSTDQVVAATGTSMANHLAMAAVLAPGDEVLIEHPTYELLVSTARYLGAEVKRFARRAEDGFRLNPEEIARVLTPRTRMIVITNLHNPSGVVTDNETLARVGELARQVGARVLVDEVYLEAMFAQRPRSAVHLGWEFLVTSSLTKAYGLGGLRCGWILCEPELAMRIWRLNDLFGVIPAHPAECLSVVAFEQLDRIAARAQQLLETNRRFLHRFLDSRSELDTVRPPFGTIVFPRLQRGSVEDLCTRLREKYETTVVPGHFFEMPQHFRLGITCESDRLAGGLERLGQALAEL